MGDKTRGLYNKFRVTRVDGTDAPGGKHHGCSYFVLDVDHDPHAVAALRAYALSCKADYPLLAQDVARMAKPTIRALAKKGEGPNSQAARTAALQNPLAICPGCNARVGTRRSKKRDADPGALFIAWHKNPAGTLTCEGAGTRVMPR